MLSSPEVSTYGSLGERAAPAVESTVTVFINLMKYVLL